MYEQNQPTEALGRASRAFYSVFLMSYVCVCLCVYVCVCAVCYYYRSYTQTPGVRERARVPDGARARSSLRTHAQTKRSQYDRMWPGPPGCRLCEPFFFASDTVPEAFPQCQGARAPGSVSGQSVNGPSGVCARCITEVPLNLGVRFSCAAQFVMAL